MASSKKVIVIGAGFAGLAAASVLAKAGYKVTVVEKNDQPGGRARVWEQDGFVFDMGPSWYWMPDVFERYFGLFGKRVADYYHLQRLDPAYRVYYGKNDAIEIPAAMPQLEALFDEIEPGSSKALKTFLAQAEYKYRVSMRDYVYRPSHAITEFLDLKLIIQSLRIQMLSSMRSHVAKYFKNPKLVKLLEFPVLFLGAAPQNTPAMYSLMNHADLVLGTWYPIGGMSLIAKGMVCLAKELGVELLLNTPVSKINVVNGIATSVVTANGILEADFIIAGADYHHVDQQLLDEQYRNYSPKYWESRTMSPSSLLFYIGLDKKLNNVEHHNLFFDEDFDRHADAIYTHARWPERPLFYASCPSKTDESIAPPGQENMFFLIPLAPGLHDDEATRERYFELMLDRFEAITGETIRGHIVLKRSYAMNDFSNDYNSFKGNAYGLANTLKQTAFFKPAMRAKKIANMLYTGQLTVPGPGVPPALISGEVAAREAIKMMER